MNFASDNVAGAHPALLQALADINDETLGSYGEDRFNAQVEQECRRIFEHDTLKTILVATGSGANALALATMTPAWGAIYCHRTSHIVVDEANAVQAATGGAALLALPGDNGKIDPEALRGAIFGKGVIHHPQPAALSLTQMNEYGVAYTLDELSELTAIAQEHGLKIHMDGARFGNAIVGLNVSPADMTWRLGVDMLVFGATKNGALAGEILVCFDPSVVEELEFRRKRAGQLFSKMRTLSAPLAAYLRDGLWLDNARHANAMAQKLAEGLSSADGIELCRQPSGNQLFMAMDPAMKAKLLDAGAYFHDWPDDGPTAVRMVTAFNTLEADVDAVIAAACG
ncbi:MAG: aminotransferase class V-fold PLP-dependent enzyme [Alphaproteobacteria bacterium TMED89]|nr:low specificity L-threonine aldolase [Rhodospirillaceae bacterium]RPH11189.1 MAG: aminotransferase class V-fold PLP-dependent enzyme [Alphaproteobacteria bacterium TMED89]